MMASKNLIDADDKYTKSSAQAFSFGSKYDGTFVKMPTHIFGFACFVLATFVVFSEMGQFANKVNYERFVVLQVEILGLVMLRTKIQTQKTVSGISGTTFLTYAGVYFGRTISDWLQLPPWNPNFILAEIGLDSILGFFSFLLVLDILKAIFVTYRSTYDQELDKCKAWHLIPGCWAMALVVHVNFTEWNFFLQYIFTSVLYMDVLALMPQVVMMAMSGSKVTTPVANFVATTAISRCGDLSHTFITAWKEYQGLGPDAAPITLELIPYLFNASAWLVIVAQSIHLLLVADFMYYYLKSRTRAKQNNQDIVLLV